MTQQPIIAIDGTAASGKGTLCRKIGSALDYAVLDTGKLYRYVGMGVRQYNIDETDDAAITKLSAELMEGLRPQDLSDPVLTTDEAGHMASVVGKIKAVRDNLFDFQQQFAQSPPPKSNGSAYKGAILDGRDIGTVIAPEADAKLYITAKTEIRAQRRTKELQSKGISVTYNAVLADMLERDKRDAERRDAPMKPADDALILDTSDMDIDQVFVKALSFIREKIDVSHDLLYSKGN